MNFLENVFTPSILQSFQVYIVTEWVVLRNLSKFHCHIVFWAAFGEDYAAKGECWPVPELPLQFDALIWSYLDVLALDHAIEHHILASRLWLAYTRRLGELAHGHLISQAFVDELCRAIITHFDLSLLRHKLIIIALICLFNYLLFILKFSLK